jgi:hypothetical protein
LFRYYKNNTKDKIIHITRSLSGTLAGDFFEMLAHDVLRKGGKFKIRRLADKTSKYPEETLDLKSLASMMMFKK